MNRTQMMAELSYLLIDPTEIHTPTERGYALDNAQNKVCVLLNNKYLSKLKVKDLNQTVTSGIYELTSLSKSLLADDENNILSVRITSGKKSTKYELNEVETLDNDYFTPSVNEPAHYFEDYNINMLPNTIEYIDIVYLRVPTEIISSGDSEISSIFHHIILKLAASEILKTEGASEKAILLEKSALDDINMFNKKYEGK